MIFDIGSGKNVGAAGKRALKALTREYLGDDATMLRDLFSPTWFAKLVTEQGEKAGKPWDIHYANNFYGWELKEWWL